MNRERPARPDPLQLFREIDALRTDEPAPAHPVDRFLARAIDVALAGVVLVVVAFGLFALIAEPVVDEPDPAASHINTAESRLAGAAGLAAAVAYIAATELGTAGRSPGKRALGLRVVTAESFDPPGNRQALVRLVAWAVPVLGGLGWWVAFFLTLPGLAGMAAFLAAAFVVGGPIFLRDDARGLHDRIAGTRVVSRRH
ncbi:MAG: RDD family protein [Dehalococcoidia bacterium]|nr:RDD family protein [Dehalococcoidia bacterium]